MPIAKIRGVELNYRIVGERGPFVCLQPGGRRHGDYLLPLAEKIAEAGYRVILYDRRNCGVSSITFEGQSEYEEWTEDLHALLGQLDARPCYIGGSSSGCRLALFLAARYPEDVRGLLLWRVTGGAFAAERLTNQYYTSHREAALGGGMAAVCGLDHWREVIGFNPKARDALMAMNPQDFIASMTRWRQSFLAGANHPVLGLSPAELRAIAVPACICPGSDPTHPRRVGEAAHRLLPNAELHPVVTGEHADLDTAFADWDKHEGLLAATFIDFLRRQQRR